MEALLDFKEGQLTSSSRAGEGLEIQIFEVGGSAYIYSKLAELL